VAVEELDQRLREVMLKLIEIEDAARGIAAEARTQAAELARIRAQAGRDLYTTSRMK
jgi:hypothetical protein